MSEKEPKHGFGGIRSKFIIGGSIRNCTFANGAGIESDVISDVDFQGTMFLGSTSSEACLLLKQYVEKLQTNESWKQEISARLEELSTQRDKTSFSSKYMSLISFINEHTTLSATILPILNKIAEMASI
ncbi:TPA: hypothetical protein ACP2VD_003979 [Escherichia coli]